MVEKDEKLRHQHPISLKKGKCSSKRFKSEGNKKLNVLITEQRCLHKEIEELELEVVTRGVKAYVQR